MSQTRKVLSGIFHNLKTIQTAYLTRKRRSNTINLSLRPRKDVTVPVFALIGGILLVGGAIGIGIVAQKN